MAASPMPRLDERFKDEIRGRIESAIVPAMEKLYGRGAGLCRDGVFAEGFRPGLKWIEKVVSYYDYWACGASVLAVLAARGEGRAAELLERLRENFDFYRTRIYKHEFPDVGEWRVPLRRSIYHLARAYEALGSGREAGLRRWCAGCLEEQVPEAIEHCRGFLPGERELYLRRVNNHAALFMQGVWRAGKVLGRADWVELARDFAERYYESGHRDGYWEENTNAEREGGPSMTYTPLTVHALYDVLCGWSVPREKFAAAGRLQRGVLNYQDENIPIFDERANATNVPLGYGLAVQSLAAEGRGLIVDRLAGADFSAWTPEGLATVYWELELMVEGECAERENVRDGGFRLTLPAGALRRGGYVAGLSALRALNRAVRAGSDYALDQQNMIYLAHRDAGVLSPGVKAKRRPEFSTFRMGEDAYTVRTGELRMGDTWVEADLFYGGFAVRARWDLGRTAVLTCTSDAERAITTSILVTGRGRVRSDAGCVRRKLAGFSPYSDGNVEKEHEALVFEWRGRVEVEFDALPDGGVDER